MCREALQRMRDFYSDPDPGSRTYNVGINKFSDLSNEEFRRLYLGGFRPSRDTQGRTVSPAPAPTEAPPSGWDWRDHSAVTGVKDQGQCGSCWSFSATGAIEGAYQIRSSILQSASEQNIIDCSWGPPYNNTGCNGGDPREALQYVIDNQGIDSEKMYPYKDGADAGAGSKCRYTIWWKVANISTAVDVIQGNETDLQYAVLHAPVSVAIDASEKSFQDYTDGIYNHPNCGNTMNDLDHAVLVVGYGNTGGAHPDWYWIVKNSWGTDWGDAGYIWMAMFWGNQCGIATYATWTITDSA